MFPGASVLAFEQSGGSRVADDLLFSSSQVILEPVS
jgi:hypothetical protein